MPETYTGDEGDQALAGGLDVMDGGEKWFDGWRAINKTRDMIAALRTWVITQLGGYLPTSEAAAPGVIAANKLVRYKANTRIPVSSPIAAEDAANKLYVDGAVNGVDLSSRVAKTGDTMTGDLFLPNSTAATSSYTVAYINADGRVSRGASSRRYKHNITDAPDLGDVFAVPLREFEMRGGDGSRRIGRIAEELVGTPLERFNVWFDGGNGDLVPDSIDFIAMHDAQISALHARLEALENRDASTE